MLPFLSIIAAGSRGRGDTPPPSGRFVLVVLIIAIAVTAWIIVNMP